MLRDIDKLKNSYGNINEGKVVDWGKVIRVSDKYAETGVSYVKIVTHFDRESVNKYGKLGWKPQFSSKIAVNADDFINFFKDINAVLKKLKPVSVKKVDESDVDAVKSVLRNSNAGRCLDIYNGMSLRPAQFKKDVLANLEKLSLADVKRGVDAGLEEVKNIVEDGYDDRFRDYYNDMCRYRRVKKFLKDNLERDIYIAGEILENGQSGGYLIDATGDVVTGDEIKFNKPVYEEVFSKSNRAKFKQIDVEKVEGVVIDDSYGHLQHTFKIEKLSGEVFNIRGRNLYKNNVFRKEWEDENKRNEIVQEKHKRGEKSRRNRRNRSFSYGEVSY